MDQVFAIGDVHGEYEMFQEVLKEFQSDRQRLILMGDLNDRGSKSKECWLLGMELVEKYQAVYLRGNHEQYFLEFMENPEDWFPSYLYNGGKETIESLLHKGATEEYSPTEITMMIRSRYKKLLKFLEERPFYCEWGDYLFVHAGVDLTKEWQETSVQDFLWIREPFHEGKNNTGKIIVFGHTITPMLYGDMQTTSIWQSDEKIGIDGGAVFGGTLHGVVFDNEGIVRDYEILNEKGPWRPDF